MRRNSVSRHFLVEFEGGAIRAHWGFKLQFSCGRGHGHIASVLIIFIFISDFQILFISDYERENKATQVVERWNTMQKVLTFYKVALPRMQDGMKRILRIIHNTIWHCVCVQGADKKGTTFTPKFPSLWLLVMVAASQPQAHNDVHSNVLQVQFPASPHWSCLKVSLN